MNKKRILIIGLIIVVFGIGVAALLAYFAQREAGSYKDALLANAEINAAEDTADNTADNETDNGTDGDIDRYTSTVESMDIMTGVSATSPAIVQVQTADIRGCGVIWDITEDKAIIVTASHVVTDWDTVSVTFSVGGSVPAKVEAISEEFDLAFCTVLASELDEATWKSIKQVTIKEESSAVSDELFMVSMNQDGVISSVTGSVLEPEWFFDEFGSTLIYCACKVQAGMSGAGVFDENGKCMGILVGASQESEAAVLSSDKIQKEYEKIENF